ncbi:TolC family outer membrane protein [Sphingomonas crusticola]|uniref:TolC family outer membrane protein n=1 Tax=Sphingomonas crusticola TaxID=1697973 RepID=UPI000E257816|nr:TolC family outer membrane protein [Sphingomonas crusticola]
MRTGGKIVAALLAGVALGAPALATTLQEAFIQTYNSSPALNAARAQLRATDEGVPIAKAESRLQASSTLGLSQNTNGIARLNNGGRTLTAQLNLSYPLFQGGRVKNAINAAESRVAGGRADLRTTEGNIFTQVVAAYMDVIRDASIVDLNKKNVDVLNTNLKASRDRFQVGDLTRTDVAQSEARLSLARSQLVTAQGNLTGSRENFRRVIGIWPETLAPPPALPPLPATPDQAVETALSNSPAIQAAGAITQAAGFDVRAARAQRLPTLAAVGGTNYNNYLGTINQVSGGFGGDNSQGSNSAGIALTVPLYQGGLVGARVRQAQAVQNQAAEQGIDVERQVIANTRAAFASYRAAAEAITANQQAVSANELALEGVRAENRVGTRTVLEVLNAEQELLNAQVDLVSAQHDQYVAGFALLNAMGEAEARDLGLDGGSLYDPTANYNHVRRWIGDWSDQPQYTPRGTRTSGPTPEAPDVAPYDPDKTVTPRSQ